MPGYDAIVVGSGPNGLSAAIALAQEGCSVLVVEEQPLLGGGARSMELTLPGFTHDVCSAVHPLAIGSPFFQTLPLARHGLEWVEPPAPLAHPLDDGAVLLERSVEQTADGLGADARAYRRLMEPLADGWDELSRVLLAPLRPLRHPVALARFGLVGLQPAAAVARGRFEGRRARALLAGLAAHSTLALEKAASASFGLVLGATAHAVGWPIPRGGAQRIADALASHLRALGGEIATGAAIRSLRELPPARAVLLDVTPRQALRIAGDALPGTYRRQLERYRYGVGAFKMDWALSAPIPWRDPRCARAATLHLGGALEEIAAAERAPWRGELAEHPFVILAQPTLFDPTRAPAGKHIAWGYCHVPNGSDADVADRIERQIERFAPGFRDVVLARHVSRASQMERYNANLVGGDLNGGAQDLRQLLRRPTLRTYATARDGLYLCSSSTPPGGGVHGMCGFFAAQLALAGLKRGKAVVVPPEHAGATP